MNQRSKRAADKVSQDCCAEYAEHGCRHRTVAGRLEERTQPSVDQIEEYDVHEIGSVAGL